MSTRAKIILGCCYICIGFFLSTYGAFTTNLTWASISGVIGAAAGMAMLLHAFVPAMKAGNRIALSFFAALFVSGGLMKAYEHISYALDGKVTTGHIVSAYNARTIRKPSGYRYVFLVGRKQYSGTVEPEGYGIGDEIMIRYSERDPKINEAVGKADPPE